MPESVLALYGAGRGPRVPTRGKAARAFVAGQRLDGTVKYHVEREGKLLEPVVITDIGEYPLPDGDFVAVEYVGKLGVMCFVRTD